METAVCTGSTASRIDVPDHWCHKVILLHFECQMIAVFLLSWLSAVQRGVGRKKVLCKRTLKAAIFGRWHHLWRPEEISTAAWLNFLMSMFSHDFSADKNVREAVAKNNVWNTHHRITENSMTAWLRNPHPSRPPSGPNLQCGAGDTPREPGAMASMEATAWCDCSRQRLTCFWQFVMVLYGCLLFFATVSIQIVTSTWYERHWYVLYCWVIFSVLYIYSSTVGKWLIDFEYQNQDHTISETFRLQKAQAPRPKARRETASPLGFGESEGTEGSEARPTYFFFVRKAVFFFNHPENSHIDDWHGLWPARPVAKPKQSVTPGKARCQFCGEMCLFQVAIVKIHDKQEENKKQHDQNPLSFPMFCHDFPAWTWKVS